MGKVKYRSLISVDNLTLTSLRVKGHSPLDLYFELYLKELESVVQQGLFKKYKSVEGNATALNGRRHFRKHIQHNLV